MGRRPQLGAPIVGVIVPAYLYGRCRERPPERAVWFSSGADPESWSALNEADARNRANCQPHLIYHPISGDLVEMIPLSHDGRLADLNDAIQVLVVATAEQPFTGFECPNLSSLAGVLSDAGIRPSFPSGPPLSPDLPIAPGRLSLGHYGASQARIEGYGPGAIDINKILRG